jgi:DNA-binding CsgD family transcriptional regulator
MEKIDLHDHFTIKRWRQIYNITQPLEKKLGFNYFSYTKVSDNGSRAILCNHPHFMRDYYLTGAFRKPRLDLSQVLTQLNHRVWSLYPNNPDNLVAQEHGIYHRTSFVVKSNKSYELYTFGSPVDSDLNDLIYLKHQQLIKQFILYFREQASELLQESMAHPIKVDGDIKQLDYYLSQSEVTAHLSKPQKRYYLGDNTYLTPCEVECLRWLSLGKTAEEIAIITETSKRTVEEHISHIKEKLHCTSLFQLGKKVAELALFD